MNITRFSIRRPVGISMIVAFFVVLGIYSYYRLGVELLPALNTPTSPFPSSILVPVRNRWSRRLSSL